MKEKAECIPQPADSKFRWEAMPDLSVKERLPLYLGVFSYKSPKSLNSSFYNWRKMLFPGVKLQKIFVQLNKRWKSTRKPCLSRLRSWVIRGRTCILEWR